MSFHLVELGNAYSAAGRSSEWKGKARLADAIGAIGAMCGHGKGVCVQTASGSPPRLIPPPSARFSGLYIYVSNRNTGVQTPTEDSIAIFENVDQGTPRESCSSLRSTELRLSSDNAGRKLKAEQPTWTSTGKLEALLTQKSGDSLERELKLRTKIIKLEKPNKTFKQKRAADATRIESLEAERTILEKRLVKYEVGDTPCLGSQGIRPANKAREPEETRQGEGYG
ncbi:hypothetical protein B0H19DRAFT_1073032 [Mycena capillaripes]|nr:hypothetical protein B0H19DRAFT_1073032 [Mycena capillaripes]